jgi:hypothetical protein
MQSLMGDTSTQTGYFSIQGMNRFTDPPNRFSSPGIFRVDGRRILYAAPDEIISDTDCQPDACNSQRDEAGLRDDASIP